jgi:hypothetical protein
MELLPHPGEHLHDLLVTLGLQTLDPLARELCCLGVLPLDLRRSP